MPWAERGKKAQAAMEYAMIAALIAIIVIPTTYIFYTYALGSAEEIDRVQIDKFGRDVVAAAETVYYLGAPSRMTLEERLPENVVGISVVQDAASGKSLLIIDVKSEGGITNFTFITDVPMAGVFDDADTSAGMKRVTVEAAASSFFRQEQFAAISFQPAKRAFASSATYDGNLGGAEGADAECQALADAAGIGGTWKAWLSTSTENAKDRITNGRYVRLDGQLIATSIAHLTTQDLINPINVSEKGETVSAAVWTGTLPDGTAHTDTCQDWSTTSPSPSGRLGASPLGWTPQWTSLFDGSCNLPFRLYCFEQ